MSYIVNAPKGGQIHLSLPFGTVTLSHGDVVNNKQLIALYPSYFIHIPDPIAPVKETVETQPEAPKPPKAQKTPKAQKAPKTQKAPKLTKVSVPKKIPFTKG
jgi:hypothetical protein